MIVPPLRRRTDPARVLARAALLLCGVALTWICAAIGLFLLTAPHGCGSKIQRARAQVAEIKESLWTYQLEHDRCPRVGDLVAGRYVVGGKGVVDPWGTDVVFWCSASGDLRVASAGPDRAIGTADDITTES